MLRCSRRLCLALSSVADWERQLASKEKIEGLGPGDTVNIACARITSV